MQGGPQRRLLQDGAAPAPGCPGMHNLTMLPAQQSPASMFKFLLDLQDCFAGMVHHFLLLFLHGRCIFLLCNYLERPSMTVGIFCLPSACN